MRPTWAEIDLAAIRGNVRAIRDVVAPSQVCAVVKADAYGHGDVPVALAALEAGASCLAVALVDEGIRLREAGVEAPIIVLSEPPLAGASDLVRWDLIASVYRPEFIDALATAAERPRPVHLTIDTGMHRVGAATASVPSLVDRIADHRTLELAGVWSHLPVADEDPIYTESQIERFDTLTAGLGVDRHLANTAGALRFPAARHDLVRIGLGLYGLHPCPETRSIVELKPALQIISRVTFEQRLTTGARPSYGRRRPLTRESTVVTVPIGYADGFPRLLSEGGEVLIGGSRFPLAGTVTMDQIVVDVGEADVSVGDEVVIIGSQQGVAITADDWAELTGTISYEVVCGIGPRVSRRHVG